MHIAPSDNGADADPSKGAFHNTYPREGSIGPHRDRNWPSLRPAPLFFRWRGCYNSTCNCTAMADKNDDFADEVDRARDDDDENDDAEEAGGFRRAAVATTIAATPNCNNAGAPPSYRSNKVDDDEGMLVVQMKGVLRPRRSWRKQREVPR